MPRQKYGKLSEINIKRAQAAIDAVKDEMQAQGLLVGLCSDYEWLDSREFTEAVAEAIQETKGDMA